MMSIIIFYLIVGGQKWFVLILQGYLRSVTLTEACQWEQFSNIGEGLCVEELADLFYKTP